MEPILKAGYACVGVRSHLVASRCYSQHNFWHFWGHSWGSSWPAWGSRGLPHDIIRWGLGLRAQVPLRILASTQANNPCIKSIYVNKTWPQVIAAPLFDALSMTTLEESVPRRPGCYNYFASPSRDPGTRSRICSARSHFEQTE